jgi:hypothetical protein
MKTEAELLMLARAELVNIAKSDQPLAEKKVAAEKLGAKLGRDLRQRGLGAPMVKMLMREVAVQVTREVEAA